MKWESIIIVVIFCVWFWSAHFVVYLYNNCKVSSRVKCVRKKMHRMFNTLLTKVLQPFYIILKTTLCRFLPLSVNEEETHMNETLKRQEALRFLLHLTILFIDKFNGVAMLWQDIGDSMTMHNSFDYLNIKLHFLLIKVINQMSFRNTLLLLIQFINTIFNLWEENDETTMRLSS